MSEQEQIFIYWDEYRDPDAIGWHWFEEDGEPVLIEAAIGLSLEASEEELIAAARREGIGGEYLIDRRRHVEGHVFPDTETKWVQLREQLGGLAAGLMAARATAGAISEDYRMAELRDTGFAEAVEGISRQLDSATGSIHEARKLLGLESDE